MSATYSHSLVLSVGPGEEICLDNFLQLKICEGSKIVFFFYDSICILKL